MEIIAALAGSLTSALRDISTAVQFGRVALTGFFLAFFFAEDAAALALKFFDLDISLPGVFFLVAYFGSEFLEQTVYIFNTLVARKKWI